MKTKTEYRVLDVHKHKFQYEAQELVDDGFYPYMGITVYETEEMQYASSGDILGLRKVIYFTQSFTKTTTVKELND